MDKGGGEKREGVSRFSVKNSLSHSTEQIPRGTFLPFRMFRVPKILMPKKRISQFLLEKL